MSKKIKDFILLTLACFSFAVIVLASCEILLKATKETIAVFLCYLFLKMFWFANRDEMERYDEYC